MEPVITRGKHKQAASRFFRVPRFLDPTVLTLALTLALLICSLASLPKLLSCALEHTSKEAMFLFCNGILLFLFKGTWLIIRPLQLCAAAADNEGRGLPAGSRKSVNVICRQQAIPGTAVPVPEVPDCVLTKVRATTVFKPEQEQEEQGQQAERVGLKEAKAGEVLPDILGDIYDQLEDDVEEEEDCQLSPEDLKKKADEFIQNFKRQRSFEAMQLGDAL